MKQVPLHTAVSITTVGASAFSVGAGNVKPISKLSLAQSQLDVLKSVAILVASEELLRASGPLANALFTQELASAVAVETDREFLAQITAGITPITSSGNTAVAILTDINAALSQLGLGAQSQVFIVVPPDVARFWCTQLNTGGQFPNLTIKGGNVFGCTVVPTDGLVNQMVMFDASQIAANGGRLELDSSKYASVQLDTTPDSPPATATPIVSFWQMNLTGLKATRYWGAERLGSRAVAVINAIANSPQ